MKTNLTRYFAIFRFYVQGTAYFLLALLAYIGYSLISLLKLPCYLVIGALLGICLAYFEWKESVEQARDNLLLVFLKKVEARVIQLRTQCDAIWKGENP